MRLADRYVGSDRRPIWPAPGPDENRSVLERWANQGSAELIAKAIKVDAQEVTRIMPEAGGEVDLSSLGPIRPGFPYMWFETGGIGALAYLTDDVPQVEADLSKNLCFSWRGDTEAVGMLAIHPFVLDGDGDVVSVRVADVLGFDASGAIVSADRFLPASVSESELHDYRYYQLAESALSLVPVALALMNCRNVVLKEEPSPASRLQHRRLKRGKHPLFRFSRIVLPRPARNGAPSNDEGKDDRAVHLVRGHFKTYTSEAPLFGRETGTWWWGWGVRGNKDAGVVIPQYELRPSSEQ